MLAFDIRPTDISADLVELVLWPASGVETRMILTRADLRRFSANLSTRAEVAVPATCALLQTTRMTIRNE
jgi:hypothetical protein